jgi:hypothetical protein
LPVKNRHLLLVTRILFMHFWVTSGQNLSSYAFFFVFVLNFVVFGIKFRINVVFYAKICRFGLFWHRIPHFSTLTSKICRFWHWILHFPTRILPISIFTSKTGLPSRFFKNQHKYLEKH